MAAATMPITEGFLELSEIQAIPASETNKAMKLLAFELWQRGSCPDSTLEQEWLDIEECILMPH
jgi:hypothetical protein